MIKEQQFRVTPQVAYNEQNIIDYISREMGIDRRTVTHVRILKKSIDARQKQIYINLTLRIFINEEPADEEYVKTEYPDVSKAPQVIVVGAGPCGLFAALKLIELGLKPIILAAPMAMAEYPAKSAYICSEKPAAAASASTVPIACTFVYIVSTRMDTRSAMHIFMK